MICTMQIRALVVSTQIRHRAIVCGQFLGEGQYFLSSPREAHRSRNARRSAKSPGGRPRVGPPRSARLRGEDLTDASKGIGASIARTLVVTYASSREGADRVVAEIAGAGSNANRRRSQRLRSRRREAAVRGDQKGVRLARRAGEQRQRLQISALRSNHRRGEQRRLPGRRFELVERIGKYLLARLDNGDRLLLHLGMTGQIFGSGIASVRLAITGCACGGAGAGSA